MNKLTGELLTRGFEPMQGLEQFRRKTKDVRAVRPRPRYGAELGFVFQNSNLSVVVWTTWVLAEGKARDMDYGWVLIEQGNDGVYFVPVRRTGRFAERLAMEAKIARCRIRNRPACPQCHAQMNIVRGRGLGSRYWECPDRHARADWDTPEFLAQLPEDAKKHLALRRANRKRGQDAQRKAGKKIRQAMLNRRKWNIVPLPVSGF